MPCNVTLLTGPFLCRVQPRLFWPTVRASWGLAGNLTGIGSYDQFSTYLPLSLNGIGPREALLDQGLTDLCGVPLGTGMIISIAGMAVYLLWGLVGGVFYLERIRRHYEK